jgi:hypothetical protein
MMAIPPHHALKSSYPLSGCCLAAFLGGAGLCILLETEVIGATRVPSGSVAAIADTGAATEICGAMFSDTVVFERMLKRGDVEQSAASHRLELRIVKF